MELYLRGLVKVRKVLLPNDLASMLQKLPKDLVK